MRDTDRDFFRQLAGHRRACIEVLISGVVIGIGVAVIANAAFDSMKDKMLYILPVATMMTLGGIFYIFQRVREAQSAHLEIRPFFALHDESNRPLGIPQYWYGDQVFRTLGVVIHNDPSIKAEWESGGTEKVALEVTEYFVLRFLSRHLEIYFREKGFPSSELAILEREDIKDVVATNSVLEYLSRPLVERPDYEPLEVDGRLVARNATFLDGKGSTVHGYDFEYFELKLPNGSSVGRGPNRKLLIDTPNFVIHFQISDFIIFGGGLEEFFEYYLGNEYIYEATVVVNVDIEFKFSSVFRTCHWDHHSWIDGFLAELHKEMDRDAFFSKIQWPVVQTMILCEKLQQSRVCAD